MAYQRGTDTPVKEDTMDNDPFEVAKLLEVVPVYQKDNVTGWVTPKALYDPGVTVPGYGRVAPFAEDVIAWVDHGTVGTNTLRYWGEGRSMNEQAGWSLANYLCPRDTTVYADSRPHDTRYTVFKMVPPGYRCNHVGYAIPPFRGSNCIGCEYESLQNGTHDITDLQYIKGALMYAYEQALVGFKDAYRLSHGLIANNPVGRRTDPWAGGFKYALSWEIVQHIRRDARIWAHWGRPQPEV